jgi:hypothetical protein
MKVAADGGVELDVFGMMASPDSGEWVMRTACLGAVRAGLRTAGRFIRARIVQVSELHQLIQG